jgi:cytidylate kinase
VIRLVTISREYGSGAGEFAAMLGAALQWPVFDRVIGAKAATRLGSTLDEVIPVEEREDSYLERLERAFSLGPPELIGHPPARSWTEAVYEAEAEEIRAIAASPPAVIVGRGSQCLLRTAPDVLHLRLYAPEQDRVERVTVRTGWARDRAARMVRSLDQARRRFLASHFGCGEDEATLYGLAINTSVVPLSLAVDLVKALVLAGSPE